MHARPQVIWRLDTGARTYLPRLAGAVTNISAVPADAAAYVLTQADNTIRMVSPHLIVPCPFSPMPHAHLGREHHPHGQHTLLCFVLLAM